MICINMQNEFILSLKLSEAEGLHRERTGDPWVNYRTAGTNPGLERNTGAGVAEICTGFKCVRNQSSVLEYRENMAYSAAG